MKRYLIRVWLKNFIARLEGLNRIQANRVLEDVLTDLRALLKEV